MGNFYNIPHVDNDSLYFDSLSTDIKKLLLCYVPEYVIDSHDLRTFQSAISDISHWKKLYQSEFSNIQNIDNSIEYFEALSKWLSYKDHKYLAEQDYIGVDHDSHFKLYLSLTEGWEKKFHSILEGLNSDVVQEPSLVFTAFGYCRVSIVKYLVEQRDIKLVVYKDHLLNVLSDYKNFEIVKYLFDTGFLSEDDLTTILREASGKIPQVHIHYHRMKGWIEVKNVYEVSYGNTNDVKEYFHFLVDNGANINILTEEKFRQVQNLIK